MQQANTILMPNSNLLNCDGKSISVCPTCEMPLTMKIKWLDVEKIVPVICDCRAKELKAAKDREKFEEIERWLDKFKKYSLMDKDFETSTFSNWEIKPENNIYYDIAKGYCDNWAIMKAKNTGMLIYGTPGCGKTYMSFAIANELYSKYVSVLAISSIGILDVIKSTYSKHSGLNEHDLIRLMQEASLLIIDDLGAEDTTKPWAVSELYKIIDARTRTKKPLIITTNLTLEQLKNKMTGTDGIMRTYDRIIGACVTKEVVGTSYRIKKAVENTKSFYRDIGLEA